MLFSIINPSDPYTMRSAELEVAAVAVALLGVGQYGLEQIGGDRSAQVPMFPTGGHDAWFQKQFCRNFEGSLDYVMENRFDELLKTLASVHIGTPADKAVFDERAAQCPDPESVTELLRELYDPKRSSANDIGRRAWNMALDLAQQRAPVLAAPGTMTQ